MSKQPCVWVVEARTTKKPWRKWSFHEHLVQARLNAGLLSSDYGFMLFRVAKYVRVEPKPKRAKRRSVTLVLPTTKFVEADCDAVDSFIIPAKKKKGRK